MTVNKIKKIKALPTYFAAYPKSNADDIDGTKVDPLQLVSHSDWRELYDSIPEDTVDKQYKLLLVARHGQGYHNQAIKRYGQKLWQEKWSILNGDEHGEWLDSKLTPVGQNQVSDTGENILVPIIEQMGFLPHIFISSPMRRCLETFAGSWCHVFNKKEYKCENESDKKINVDIYENIRETLNAHPCNERIEHSKAVKEYQNYRLTSGHTVHWQYEDDYPENDMMWKRDWVEKPQVMDKRIDKAMKVILEECPQDKRFISITCHSKVIESLLRVTDHPAVHGLETAKIVGLVVELQQ